MTRLRFKIIKQKNVCHPLKSDSFFQNKGRRIHKNIKRTLNNDTIPLIITPFIFVAFVGLQWWHWYIKLPTPSPVLLSVTALGLSIYCLYKFAARKKRTVKQESIFKVINEQPILNGSVVAITIHSLHSLAKSNKKPSLLLSTCKAQTSHSCYSNLLKSINGPSP